MGIPDRSLPDLIEKVRCWITRGRTELRSLDMPGNGSKMCCECHTDTSGIGNRYHCQSCGRWICGECVQGGDWDGLKSSDGVGEETIKFCKFCSLVRLRREGGWKCSEKVHPSVSPRDSPEPPSPCFSNETIKCSADDESTVTDHLSKYLEGRDIGCSPRAVSSMPSFSSYPSPVAVHRSHSRSDEEEAVDSAKTICSEYCDDNLDIDSVSARSECNSVRSMESSQYDCSSRIYYTSNREHSVQQRQERIPVTQVDVPFDQQTKAVLKKPERRTEDPDITDDFSAFRSQYEKPLDFENNGLIWYPPPPMMRMMRQTVISFPMMMKMMILEVN